MPKLAEPITAPHTDIGLGPRRWKARAATPAEPGKTPALRPPSRSEHARLTQRKRSRHSGPGNVTR